MNEDPQDIRTEDVIHARTHGAVAEMEMALPMNGNIDVALIKWPGSQDGPKTNTHRVDFNGYTGGGRIPGTGSGIYF